MSRLFRLQLTTKLVLLTVAAVLPALAIQGYNEYDLRRSREHDMRERVVQITKQFGEEMGELREGARQLLVALARVPMIARLDGARCDQLLTSVKGSYPNYESLSVSDMNGQIVCSSATGPKGSIADLPVFQRAVSNDNLVVGNYWKNPANGVQVIHFARKFVGADGQDKGVVFAALDLNWLSAHLADRGLQPTASILIADREGNIIARLPNPAALVGKNMRKSHEAIMDGDQTGSEEAKGVDGVTRIFGFLPAALPPGDLFLSAGLSKSEAFADIDRATQRGILLIVTGLMVAIAAALYGGWNFIQKPIRDLTRVATDWRDGNYEVRVPTVKSGSELAQLASAFNDMADAVTSRQAAQKQAEKDLMDLASTLEERVERRTEELAFANRVKSQFLANMSHEIRTPMNGVLGMLELLLDDELSPKQQRLARTALRSGESLVNIVNGVLDLSKIESGKLELSREPFNLHTMIEEAVELFAGAARSKKINLAHLISPETPRQVIGDEGRIRQILTNVLGNAVKFTSTGEVVLYVGAAGQGADDMMLEFTVRDTGIGIPAEKQGEIFDLFAQADGSTTRRYGGTGLGLNIARQLCEMMGGSISVESERGTGSVFHFSCVVGKVTDRTPMDIAEDWSALNGRTALIIDDNTTNLEILESNLTRVGVQTCLATSAEAGLNILQQSADSGTSFDFVLIDRILPIVDGLELARWIRADPALAGIQIVMLSSSDDLPEVSEVERERWLMKPVRRIELYECLLRSSSAHSPAEPMQPAPARAPASFTGVRALLVEDNDINLEVSRTILQREGCRVSIATDGLKGLAAYEHHEFDVIFMDCHMPEMDGFRATAAIRALEAESHRHTPIIALTANAIEGDREVCLRAGMDDYLSKPISRNAIRVMLERWCQKTSIQATDQETSSPPADHVLCEKALGMLRELENDDGRGIVRRVMASFLRNSPELLDKLGRGKEARDAETLRTASHTLKSTSVVVGAVSLSMRCARLETLAREGQVDEAIALVDGIIAEYQHVRPAIEAQLRSGTGDAPVDQDLLT